MSYAYWNN
jgi:nicotinate phosphoribosyltransferase